ncbi:hypothetical protein [Desulfosarcina ovata]|nr:hypothetical protein [Desulfosarcina ovata]
MKKTDIMFSLLLALDCAVGIKKSAGSKRHPVAPCDTDPDLTTQ